MKLPHIQLKTQEFTRGSYSHDYRLCVQTSSVHCMAKCIKGHI